MKILKIKTEKRRVGDLGERAAARFLRRHGYRILERNYVACGSEIDIIAQDRTHIAFVEVKTRNVGSDNPKEPRPASAVTPEKQRKIMTAASYYKAYHPNERRMRMDIIEVYVEGAAGKERVKEINHMTGAYDRSSCKIYKI